MSDMASGWYSLHVGEFYLLWTELDLGELPVQLGIEHIGRTPRARAEFVTAAGAVMARRGLGTVERPAPDLAGRLGLLANAEIVAEFEIGTPADHLRALGAIHGERAVAVARVGTDVRIGSVAPGEVTATLFDAMRPLSAGPGMSATVSVDVFEDACAASSANGTRHCESVLIRAGLRGDQAALVARVVDGRVGGGRCGARVADGGRWRRAPSPVTWVDLDHGRYLVRRRDSWVTVEPVGNDRLVGLADEMIVDLTRRAGDNESVDFDDEPPKLMITRW